MNPAPTRKRASLRLSLLTLLLMAMAAAVGAPGVGAGPQRQRGVVVSQGSKPFTESVAQMRRRDLARRAANLAANVSPSHRANPVHPKPPKTPHPQNAFGTLGEGFYLPSTAPTASAVGASFQGIRMQDQFSLGSWSYPPDTMGAVGPNHFVQVINGSVAIFVKSTGALHSHISLNSFFTFTANSTPYPRNGAFDPRVLYDRKSGRWFVCALEFGQLVNGFGTNNHLLLAVSRTSDPTQAFDKYVLPVGEPTVGTTAGFTDYPTLGVDSNGVYAAVRIFTFDVDTGSSKPSFAKLAVTPLASLIAGSPSLGTVTQLSNIQDMYSTPQPATNLDANSPSSPAWFFSTSSSSSNLVYRTVTWSGGTPSFSGATTLSTPAAAVNFPNNNTVPALNSTTPINVGDARLQSATILNNRLWTARNVAVNASGTFSSANRIACEWFEINVSGATPSLVQSGRVFDSAVSDPRHYYYPGIMVNGQGHAVMGFSGSKSTEFVGAYYAGRLATDTAGTMGEPALLKAGTGKYVQNDPNGRNRWGDYSHTTLDPGDKMSLWTVQEYAESTGSPVGSNNEIHRWGTRVAKLLSLPPTLNAPTTVEVQRGNIGVTLNLTGTNFYDPGAGFTNRLAAQLTGGSPNGITNVATTYNSPTSATVTFDVAANAEGGARGLTLTNPDGQAVSVSNAVNVVVAATASLDFSSAAYAVAEGAGTAIITVNRTGVTSGTSTVNYATSNGTATVGSDYTTTSGTLTFTAGETSKTFNIPIANDTLLEGSETVNLTLSSPTGGLLGSVSTAALTISNNAAAPRPTGLSATVLSLASISLAWSDNCGNETGYQVERKAGGGGFSLLTTANANATSAMDSGPFTAGTVYTYRVRAANGALTSDYSNESSAAITALEFASATTTIAEGGAAMVTVNRTGDTSIAASATITVSGGTATSAADFTAPGATVSFSSGQTTRTLSLPALADALLEGDETVVLTLSAPSGAGVVLGAQTTTTVTITDNVAAPAPTGLTAAVQSGTEIALSWTDNCGNETGYEVERSTAGGAFILVATKTAGAVTHVDGGLSRGVEYSYRVRAVRPGLASGYSNTTGAAIDGVQLSSGAYTVAETGGAVMIIVSRTGSAMGQVTVDYATSAGAATDGTDYTGVQGTLTFGNGEITKTIVITVADDALIEGAETFGLTLSNAGGIGLGAQTSATVTITDNATAPQPTNLAASVLGAALVRLTWQDNSGNESGFRIERKVGAGSFATLATVGANVITYDDTTVTLGTAHSYRVIAVAGAAESGVSDEATVTIASGARAVITPKKLAFGKVKVGKTKLKTLKIKNTGRGILQGTVGALDPRFTVEAGAGAFTLARNKTHVVRVRYTPTVAETISTMLTITTTDPKKATVNVKTTAKGV